LHMAQLMPLPLTVSCFSKIQIGFTFLVPAHPDSAGKGPVNVCVCLCVCVRACVRACVRCACVRVCESDVSDVSSCVIASVVQLLLAGPASLNFGEVCARSTTEREVSIINNLDVFVHVVIKVRSSCIYCSTVGVCCCNLYKRWPVL